MSAKVGTGGARKVGEEETKGVTQSEGDAESQPNTDFGQPWGVGVGSSSGPSGCDLLPLLLLPSATGVGKEEGVGLAVGLTWASSL